MFNNIIHIQGIVNNLKEKRQYELFVQQNGKSYKVLYQIVIYSHHKLLIIK